MFWSFCFETFHFVIGKGRNMIKENRRAFFVYGGAFLVLFGLCWLFPYSGDDWAWGSQLGLDRLSNWFDNYSGRYFGNLIVIALTRSNLLKSLVMALCITGIAFILNEMTKRQKCGLVMICMFLAFMPVVLLRQAVVWTSGFANYTTSIFLTLIYIYYCNGMYAKKMKNSILAIVPLLALGFANTLIVEHMTIYNVVLSIYIIVFNVIKYKKVYIQHIAYFIGSIAGTATMFSNSVYSSVSAGTDGYRTIATESSGIIERGMYNFCRIIVKEGVLNNFVLLCGLLIMVLGVWFSYKKELSKSAKIIGGLSVTVLVAYTALSIMHQITGYVIQAEILIYLEALATVFYFIAFAVFILILPVEMVKRIKMLFILGSAACIMAPLTVVTPIGSRCFLPSYVMFIYLALELYSNFTEDKKQIFANLNKVIVIVVAVGTVYLFYIYGTIYKNNNERIEKALADVAKGKTTIEVQQLPYNNYVWTSDLTDPIWSTRFKLYYGIDKDVQINMVPNK